MVDERHLGRGADGFDPETELALLEHPHHLEPRDRRPRCSHGLEAEGRADQAFELAMFALKAVVRYLASRCSSSR